MSSVYIVSSILKGKMDILEAHAGSAYAFVRAEEVSREYALIHGGKVNHNPKLKNTINGPEWIFYTTDNGEVKVSFKEIFVPVYNKS